MSTSKQSKNYSKSMSNKKNKNIQSNTSKALLLPIVLIVAVLPLITRQYLYTSHFSKFPWYPNYDKSYDFFLFYKQVFFTIISLVIFIIILSKAMQNKRQLSYSAVFIPLGVYALTAILSTVFSKYRIFSFRGTLDQCESIFVLLGYCLAVYYTFLVVQSEQDVKYIIKSLIISVFILSFLGLTQFTGHDFFASKIGLKLITPSSEWNSLDAIKFVMGEGRVYLTLFNPNYVGVYTVLVAPILFILLLFNRELKLVPVYLLALLGILICLIGSGSKSGIVSLIAVSVLGLIVMSKYIIKYFYVSIPIALLILAAVFLYNKTNDNILLNQIKAVTDFTKNERALTDIQTNDDEIIITYNKNNMHLRYFYEDGISTFTVYDDNASEIPVQLLEGTDSFISLDDRFPGFMIGLASYQNVPFIYVTIEGFTWNFTNQTEDGTYYYLNRFGKLDKIKSAPSAVFTNYDSYASGRGYIWSRTIPLLKKYPILGSGPDTYVMAFPQQDYVNLFYNSGENLLTKPHNLYLQMAVQTGVLSVLAFLVFYAMYFISSIRLYIRGNFNSYYAQVGLAIFLGTFGYMVMGLANDSSLTVAPVFWVFIGLGLALNRMVRSHMVKDTVTTKNITK